MFNFNKKKKHPLLTIIDIDSNIRKDSNIIRKK